MLLAILSGCVLPGSQIWALPKFLQLCDTDSDVAIEAADVLDEACEDEVRWTQFITI